MEEDLVLKGTYRNKKDTENIEVYGIEGTTIDGKEEIYIKVKYKGKMHNIILHEKVFPKGESPYSEDIVDVPYFVIEGDVYYLDDIFEIGFSDIY